MDVASASDEGFRNVKEKKEVVSEGYQGSVFWSTFFVKVNAPSSKDRIDRILDNMLQSFSRRSRLAAFLSLKVSESLLVSSTTTPLQRIFAQR